MNRVYWPTFVSPRAARFGSTFDRKTVGNSCSLIQQSVVEGLAQRFFELQFGGGEFKYYREIRDESRK